MVELSHADVHQDAMMVIFVDTPVAFETVLHPHPSSDPAGFLLTVDPWVLVLRERGKHAVMGVAC